jgi:hypothetical protein
MTELKSFKISDQMKPTVDQPRAKEEPAPSTGSAGFPKIEALVEAAMPDTTGLEQREAELLEMSKGKGTNKEKASAKKAAQAYNKTRALIAYLVETKHKMQGGRSG